MNDSINYEAQARKMAEYIRRLSDIQPEDTRTLDDKGFSSIFADMFKDELRYNVTAGEWFFFDGRRWVQDNGGLFAQRLARDMSDYLLIYARRIKDNSAHETFVKAATKYGGLRYRETLVRDARSLLAVEQSHFDVNSHLLNLANCTLDLQTMRTHEHKPEDMLTKISETEYNPNADGTRWNAFLAQVFQDNAEKISYLQRICGYCLTAGTELEAMFLLYGPSTRNGKSTFVETFARVLGDYAATAQPETIAISKARQGGAASPDLARLAGVRFLNISEPPRKMLLDVALVKQLTGGDTITARKLYQAPFEFKPKFKLMVNTNSLPTVTDDTLFTSERVRILTFDRHFDKSEQNPRLKQELSNPDTQSAILNWALDGLRIYRLEGEQPPQCVLAATSDFKTASDKILRFFGDCMEKATTNTAGGDAYSRYIFWCNENGFTPENKGRFFAALRERGLLAKAGTIDGKTVKNVVLGYQIMDE